MHALPQPYQLAALGAVLCLYRAQAGGELAGWARAVRAAREGALDSEGLREGLVFFDRDDRVCWRLYLLPDTDFLAWERLAADLPQHRTGDGAASVGERLWRRLAGRAAWQANVMCLHALPAAPGFASLQVLAASLAPLSPLGAVVARRIVRDEGAEGEGIIDDCCCRQAAARATAMAHHAEDAPAYSIIRFNLREQA